MEEVYMPIIHSVEKLTEKYHISNYGNIKNIKTNNILKKNIHNGYYTVNITDNIKTYTITVSRMVAMVFIKNPEKKNIVNHIAGNKLNNNINNLEWVTQIENIRHALNNNLIKINKKKVIQFDKENNKINEFESIEKAAKHINLTYHAIIRVLKNKNKTAGGYIWKYMDCKDEPREVNLQDYLKINNYNYMINNKGDVYSNKTKKNLAPIKNQNGYYYITLTNKNGKKNFYIHQLVAKYFIKNINDDKKFVNHINRIKTDNRVENLEWVTHKENIIHYHNTK
jgi:hypothetical protein